MIPPARMSPILPHELITFIFNFIYYFFSSLSFSLFPFLSVYLLLSRTAREAFRHGLYYVLFVLTFVLTMYSVLSYIHLHTPLIHTSGG